MDEQIENSEPLNNITPSDALQTITHTGNDNINTIPGINNNQNVLTIDNNTPPNITDTAINPPQSPIVKSLISPTDLPQTMPMDPDSGISNKMENGELPDNIITNDAPQPIAPKLNGVDSTPEIKINNSESDLDKNKGISKIIVPIVAFFKNKKVLTIILLVAFILSLLASGVLGYFLLNKNREYKSQQTLISNKSEDIKKQEITIKQLKDDLAAAIAAKSTTIVTPAATPAPASATTPKKKATSTSTPQETVTPPPPPPSD